MSDENSEDIDNYIVYEIDKDCDPAEIVEYEDIVVQEEEEYEEIEQIEDVEYDNALKSYEIEGNIEALEDEEILQEHIQPLQVEIENDTKEFLNIDEPVNTNNVNTDLSAESAEHAAEFIVANKTPANLKKSSSKLKKSQQRYLLFDDLVATVVDFDDSDQTPIVQFAICSSPGDEKLHIECGICPDVMPKNKLAAHLKKHLVPGTNRYKCLYCSETYKDYKYLASHSRRHMGIRPYVCETCNLYFSTKQDMRVHNQRRHQEKEHICEVCGKTFAQNTMLKRHRESTHEKKRRFQCEHCPKAYYKNFSLQEHIRSVHMGQRRMLKCPFCGMQCLDAHKMARHRKLWHLNQKHYECEICDEKFTNVNYFDAHKRSIQCRQNTRKQEEARKKAAQKEAEDTQQQPLKVEDETETKVESNADDIVWQLHEESATNGNKIYDNNEQYVELVVPEDEIDEIFEQDGSVLFEITLESDENN